MGRSSAGGAAAEAREAWVARAAGGGIVPVVRECLLDADQPVAVLRKLARPPFAFLLESAVGGERWARYTFLGTEPREAWRYQGGTASRWTPAGGWGGPTPATDPMGHLGDRLRALGCEPRPDLPRFFGGAVAATSPMTSSGRWSASPRRRRTISACRTASS